MQRKNRRSMPLAAGLLWGSLLVLGAGCLVSSTELFDLLIGTFDVNGGEFEQATIDLSEDETFNDHKDEIEVIDRVGFMGDVTNHSGQDALLSVYFSTQAGLTDPVTQATPIFVNVPIPAAGRTVTYEESLDLLQNFDQLQEAIKGGVITFYTTANGTFNLTVNDLTMIITFTVGL